MLARCRCIPLAIALTLAGCVEKTPFTGSDRGPDAGGADVGGEVTGPCTSASDCAGGVTLGACQRPACVDGTCAAIRVEDGTPCNGRCIGDDFFEYAGRCVEGTCLDDPALAGGEGRASCKVAQCGTAPSCDPEAGCQTLVDAAACADPSGPWFFAEAYFTVTSAGDAMAAARGRLDLSPGFLARLSRRADSNEPGQPPLPADGTYAVGPDGGVDLDLDLSWTGHLSRDGSVMLLRSTSEPSISWGVRLQPAALVLPGPGVYRLWMLQVPEPLAPSPTPKLFVGDAVMNANACMADATLSHRDGAGGEEFVAISGACFGGTVDGDGHLQATPMLTYDLHTVQARWYGAAGLGGDVVVMTMEDGPAFEPALVIAVRHGQAHAAAEATGSWAIGQLSYDPLVEGPAWSAHHGRLTLGAPASVTGEVTTFLSADPPVVTSAATSGGSYALAADGGFDLAYTAKTGDHGGRVQYDRDFVHVGRVPPAVDGAVDLFVGRGIYGPGGAPMPADLVVGIRTGD